MKDVHMKYITIKLNQKLSTISIIRTKTLYS
jgi:hypothetical protein